MLLPYTTLTRGHCNATRTDGDLAEDDKGLVCSPRLQGHENPANEDGAGARARQSGIHQHHIEVPLARKQDRD
jgi:hypothetical protein